MREVKRFLLLIAGLIMSPIMGTYFTMRYVINEYISGTYGDITIDPRDKD